MFQYLKACLARVNLVEVTVLYIADTESLVIGKILNCGHIFKSELKACIADGFF